MRLGLDLGPLLAFFIANSFGGIFTATTVFMLAMAIAVAIGFAIERKVSPVAMVTFALVLVFGSLTIWLSNDLFIKIKPTIIYILFAAILLTGAALRKPFIKHVLQGQLHLTDRGWQALTLRFGLFFVLAAILNEVVWRNFSFDFWITYKVWGMTGLTFVFTAWQMMFVSRYHVAPAAPLNSTETDKSQHSTQSTPQG